VINTYKNITTKYYIFGVRFIDGIVLLVASVLILRIVSAILGLLVFIVGYYFARKYRGSKLEYLDILAFLSEPSRFGINKEYKNVDK